MTPLRKEKDERRANYEKRRDQRRRSVHSSDHEAKKEIPKLTSTPKKTKKPKARLLKYFLIVHLYYEVIQNDLLVALKRFILKPNKQVTARRQSTVKNNNDEASPTESELQNKETKSSQTTLERFFQNNSRPPYKIILGETCFVHYHYRQVRQTKVQ